MTVSTMEANPVLLRALRDPPRDHEPMLIEPAAVAFEAMRRAARADGLDVVPVSGFRDVARQRAIWVRKFEAATAHGASPQEAVASILAFSAPPGFSRHHWGTDVDVVGSDLAQEPRLEPEDWAAGGVCAALDSWIEDRAADFGFRRPYDQKRRGYEAEPWHLSYAPVAIAQLAELSSFDFRRSLEREPFPGSEVIAADLEAFLRDFVFDVAPSLRPVHDDWTPA